MAYEFPMLDTSQRAKFQQMLQMLAPTDQYFSQIQGAGRNALQQNFDAAQSRIGAQFNPVMRLASARLAGSPLLADSGYANRQNRQIQTAAFGDLSRAYGDASAENANSQLGALERLLQARMQTAGNIYGGAQKKQSGWASALGAGLGTAGAFL
jgi:hypothetical protein